MKRLLVLVGLLTASLSLASEWSAGLIIGSPTGLSAKYDLSETNSIATGISTGHTYIDYRWERADGINIDNMKWYYGPGLLLRKNLGVRGNIGAEYFIQDTAWHAFGETGVGFVAGDKLSTHLSVALGGRFNF